jgi:hypothetical protein
MGDLLYKSTASQAARLHSQSPVRKAYECRREQGTWIHIYNHRYDFSKVPR